MSVIGEAIHECMGEVTKNDDTLTASFVFCRSFVGFNGHFPERPVLPGVCIVQAVLVMYEAVFATSLRIVAIENVKFVSAVTEGEELIFEASGPFSEKEECLIRAKVYKGETKVATVKVRLRVDLPVKEV